MEIKITVLWHTVDEFYNVRIPKGMSTISQSTNRMRGKIYGCEGVKWNYHVVLSMSNETVDEYKDGIDSKMLTDYFKKTKEVFGKDLKYFWKYEEGRKSERPHFHLLLDLKEDENSNREIEKLLEMEDVYKFEENQKKYEMNKKKSDKEIIMGYLFYKIWGKGIVYARRIRTEWDLVQQVEKDVAKRTGTEGFKPNKKKYGFSKGIKVKKSKKGEYEFAGKFPIEEARDYLESTRDNFIESFTEKSYDGAVVYERTIEDLDKYERSTIAESKNLEDKTIQEKFDIDKLLGKVKEMKETIRK